MKRAAGDQAVIDLVTSTGATIEHDVNQDIWTVVFAGKKICSAPTELLAATKAALYLNLQCCKDA